MLVIVTDVVALGVCALAVVGDLRTMRIPNRLTLSALACGLLLDAVLGFAAGGIASSGQWLAAGLAGALVGLVVFGIPAALGLVGMGDVKLAMALGGLVRWPLALALVLYAAIAGGVLALVYAVARRQTRQVALNLARLEAAPASHRMPYALAIALGTTWAVASRHVEALRLL